MRRPDWWPPALWPGRTKNDVDRAPSRVRDEGLRETAHGSGPTGAGPAPRDAPWPSLVRLLVEALGAASGAVWTLDPDTHEWSVAAERRREGWTGGPERTPRPERGHAFSWAAREDLVLQVPAERIREEDREGWVLVVPDPGGRRLVELWFASAPGPAVREAADAIRAHLAWLASAGGEEGAPG